MSFNQAPFNRRCGASDWLRDSGSDGVMIFFFSAFYLWSSLGFVNTHRCGDAGETVFMVKDGERRTETEMNQG